MQSHFRPTAAYTASVVLIEAARPSRAPLPVLSRGPVDPATGRDRGIAVVPNVVPPLPLLRAAVPPDRQPVAAIGDTIRLEGQNLDGTGREVVLTSDRLGVEAVIPALPPASPPEPADNVVEFSLAGQSAMLPAGLYRVVARLVRPGETAPRETNRVALMIAPRMTNLPLVVARAADGSASFTVEFMPALRAGQSTVLILGTAEHEPQGGGASPASELTFVVADAPVGTHLARLRIDDVESPIVGRSAEPPAPPTFLDQTVRFT